MEGTVKQYYMCIINRMIAYFFKHFFERTQAWGYFDILWYSIPSECLYSVKL